MRAQTPITVNVVGVCEKDPSAIDFSRRNFNPRIVACDVLDRDMAEESVKVTNMLTGQKEACQQLARSCLHVSSETVYSAAWSRSDDVSRVVSSLAGHSKRARLLFDGFSLRAMVHAGKLNLLNLVVPA
jgi:hypothetical protein